MEKEKIFVEGIEVKFNDLLESSQEKLYLQNKEKFEAYAAKSQFSKIRKLVVEDPNAKAVNLDEIFKIEIEGCAGNVKTVWKHPNFQRTDEKRKMLSKLNDMYMRIIPAADFESSSKFLNEQIGIEMQGYEQYTVIKAILNNHNLKLKEKYRKMLANSNWRNIRILVVNKGGCSSIFLNEMLRKELEKVNDRYGIDRYVIEEILQNDDFIMEEETRQMLAKSEDYEFMESVAKDMGSSSELLNKMLRTEIRDKVYTKVFQAILDNENFNVEDKTLKVLCEHGNAQCRKAFVRSGKISYDDLEKMYLTEKDEEVLSVIELNMLRKLIKQYPLSK